MVRQRTVLLWFVLSFILMMNSPHAFSCSCGRESTVLEAFEWADLVVLTKAVSVERADSNTRAQYGVKSTKMVVEKSYKGNSRTGDELVFAQGGGSDCIFTFKEEEIGHRYLFYLKRPANNPPIYVAGTCGRSNDVRWAIDDLLYLDNLDKVRGRTRISGKLGNWAGEDPGFVGRKIKIIQNDKVWEITTDKDGVYEIYDLPAGEYLIEPEIPRGWKINSFYIQNYAASFSGDRNEDRKVRMKRIPISLEKGKHAGLDVIFDIDNAIRGRVLSPEGKPMQRVCLHAIRSNGDPRGIYLDCTEANGEFEIDEIPQGDFLLVANERGEITGDEPFGPLYHPGVFDRKKATVFTMGAGTFIDNIVLQVPAMKERIEVSGRLLYSDGTPMDKESVFLKFKPDTSSDKAKAENVGTSFEGEKFSFHLLKGSGGILFGTIMVYKGIYKNCPAVEKIVGNSGSRLTEIQSNVIRIKGTEDVSGLQLSFPFPHCEKSNDSIR